MYVLPKQTTDRLSMCKVGLLSVIRNDLTYELNSTVLRQGYQREHSGLRMTKLVRWVSQTT
jgi:hypothetical protein